MSTLAVYVNVAFEILIWLIIGRCFLSLVPHNPRQPIIRFIYDVTEPVLAPFRRFIPTMGPGIDFSPLMAILVLGLLQTVLVKMLLRF
ncbi:MAG: YggT family protein [Firmicutes bacterium]|nr:YggT family protein [Bacillota bacterium]